MFIALPAPADAFTYPSLLSKRGRSTAFPPQANPPVAERSGRSLLFRPSSLQGRSDFPCARNASLAGFTQLEARLPRWSPEGTRGSQVRVPVIFPCMPLTFPQIRLWRNPGSPIGAHALCVALGDALTRCFPIGNGLPHKRRGSACSPHCQVYPATGLSQLCQTGVRLRGCRFG